jgi:cellulase
MYVNGASQGKLTGIRAVNSNNPITDVNSNDMICNGGANPYHQPISQTVIKVAAGSSVTTEWHHTLAGAQSGDADEPIAASHHGPVITYLAKVNDPLSLNVSGLKWFKIYQDGLSGGSWGVDRMVQNKGKVTFKIPSCIPAGNYLMRHEIIALHSAYNYPGAQFYVGCAQLQVTGGGNANPSTVSFPGAYKSTDPGVKLNIYPYPSSYTVPGPSVFSC